MTKLIDLYFAFFRIGALTFGGGYAMMPMLEREVVSRFNWATSDELLDYYAISQCTPGVIAVNVSTIIGNKQRGVVGAATATLGVITPSFFIILIIASILQEFSHLIVVQHAFSGIRVAVSALILMSILKLFKGSIVDKLTTFLFILSLSIAVFTPLSPVFIIIISACLGVVFKKILSREGK